MSKDYYSILGVPRTASQEEIKRAYKKLAKQHHPDVNKNAEATERFKEINEAASVLGNEEKRRQYDATGHEAFTQAGRGGFNPNDFSGFHGVDIDDIFEMFTGGMFGGRPRQRHARGDDLRYDVTLTLEEVAKGVTREVRARKHARCGTCDGKGGKDRVVILTAKTAAGTSATRNAPRSGCSRAQDRAAHAAVPARRSATRAARATAPASPSRRSASR